MRRSLGDDDTTAKNVTRYMRTIFISGAAGFAASAALVCLSATSLGATQPSPGISPAASSTPTPAPSPSPLPLPMQVGSVAPAGCLLMVVAWFSPVPAPVDRSRIAGHPPAGGTVSGPVCTMATALPSPSIGTPAPTADPHASPAPTSRPILFEDVGSRELPFQSPPQILRIELSDAQPHSDELLLGRVLTTTNVDAVFLRFGGFQAQFAHQDAGVFTFAYNIPGIPFFMKHAITVTVVAQTTDGRNMSVPVPIQLR